MLAGWFTQEQYLKINMHIHMRPGMTLCSIIHIKTTLIKRGMKSTPPAVTSNTEPSSFRVYSSSSFTHYTRWPCWSIFPPQREELLLLDYRWWENKARSIMESDAITDDTIQCLEKMVVISRCLSSSENPIHLICLCIYDGQKVKMLVYRNSSILFDPTLFSDRWENWHHYRIWPFDGKLDFEDSLPDSGAWVIFSTKNNKLCLYRVFMCQTIS